MLFECMTQKAVECLTQSLGTFWEKQDKMPKKGKRQFLNFQNLLKISAAKSVFN